MRPTDAHGDPEKLRSLSEQRRELWDEVRSTTRERQDEASRSSLSTGKSSSASSKNTSVMSALNCGR